MNANTALKINDAIDQAVWCGESLTDIHAQIHNALTSALRRKGEARVKEAQANLDALAKAEQDRDHWRSLATGWKRLDEIENHRV